MNTLENIVFLSAALATVSGFYIQAQEYIRSMVRGQFVQAILIATTIFVLAFVESSIDLVVLGLLVLVLRGYLITELLERRIPGKGSDLKEKDIGIASHLLLDLVFIMIGTFIIYSLVFSRITFSIAGMYCFMCPDHLLIASSFPLYS